jgi:restriction endonuclease
MRAPSLSAKDSGAPCIIAETALVPAVTDLLASYQIERHIRKDQDEGPNRLKKEVHLSPEFKALWDRINSKTNYRVEFETEVLVRRAVEAVKRMEKIQTPTRRWPRRNCRCRTFSPICRTRRN